jgi:glycosyltransferase involved in cell wall biosynthesis
MMKQLERVIIVNDVDYVVGGSDKVALSTAVALSKLGFQVTLFCAIGNGNESYFRDRGIDVVCLYQQDIVSDSRRFRAMFRGLYNVKAKAEFDKMLKLLSPETTIVHFHGWTKALSISLFSVTAKNNFKVIITVHDYFSICSNGVIFNYKKQQICRLNPMSIGCILSNCDRRKYTHKLWRVIRQFIQNRTLWKNKPIWFISISRLNRGLIEKYLQGRDIRLCDIGNPVELNESVPVQVQENDTYFFIGRLSAEKGVDLFCEAITSLGVKGVVLGDGYMLPELKRKYPSIGFLGNIKSDRMGELLHSCRALIFPSLWYEGAPLTVTEVMSYGIPCIVPDKCAAAENVQDGKTGYIFKSGSLESLKKAITKAQTMDISCVSDNIIQNFAPSRYSMDTHLDKLLNLYHDVLA